MAASAVHTCGQFLADVRGRVVSRSSAGTSGFKGTRRGTLFDAQTVAANVIRTVVDQGQADTMGIAMRRALLGEIEVHARDDQTRLCQLPMIGKGKLDQIVRVGNFPPRL
nr:30S ribosomal protein S11, chloroplastic-like [Nicotiana tomentosiformis]